MIQNLKCLQQKVVLKHFGRLMLEKDIFTLIFLFISVKNNVQVQHQKYCQDKSFDHVGKKILLITQPQKYLQVEISFYEQFALVWTRPKGFGKTNLTKMMIQLIHLELATNSGAKTRESLACQITSPFNKKIGCFCKAINVTILCDSLHFGQLFKACGNILFPNRPHFRQFFKVDEIFHFVREIIYGQV